VVSPRQVVLRYAAFGKIGKIDCLYGAYPHHGTCERMRLDIGLSALAVFIRELTAYFGEVG